jgi:hypothetical protein
MSKKDWNALAAVAAVGGAVVTIHGITTRRWQAWHTLFVVLAAVAAAGPYLNEA